jgi:hypothetical protein
MTPDALSKRALNRATLARQLLLERSTISPLDAVTHLVGLQAQEPSNPYAALWSRLQAFEPAALERLLLDRAVVRIVVMRGTIHLVTADDCLVLRPLAQPVLDAELTRHRDFAPSLRGADLAPVLSFVRPLIDATPMTQAQIRAAIAEQFPAVDPAAMAYACRNHLALVQVPPRGLWHRSGQVRSTTAEAWLGRPLVDSPSLDDVVLRYFAAFGPATVADVTTWSRLTGLREVVDRVRPCLRPFRDERGRELFDLPGAPRPHPDTPAPVRFLPQYDNVLLSHADRSRFQHADERKRRWHAPVVRGTVLHDGVVRASWHLDGHALVVHHAPGLTKREQSSITAEGRRLLRFHGLDAAAADVRFVNPA